MSLAKAVPEDIKDRECKKALQEHPLVPYVPEKDPIQETGSALRSDQSLKTTHRGRCGTMSPHLALCNA
jgi:hypothetical protein